jgi:hypothetical protein
VQADWSAVCRESQLFGTLQWRVPNHLEMAALPVFPTSADDRAVGGPALSSKRSAGAPIVIEALAEPVESRKAESGA